MDVVAGHVVADYVSGRGHAHARHGLPRPRCGSAPRRFATLASASGFHGFPAAYGGDASVGFQPHHRVELPGAPRSRARLAFCMTLEATGNEAMAQAAGRRMLARSATATSGRHVGVEPRVKALEGACGDAAYRLGGAARAQRRAWDAHERRRPLPTRGIVGALPRAKGTHAVYVRMARRPRPSTHRMMGRRPWMASSSRRHKPASVRR